MFRNKIVGFFNAVAKTPNNFIHTSRIRFDETKIEKSINQVNLLGRVGNDPQKRGNEEHPVVIFSLATHNNYKYDSGDMMQRTDWHRVSVFRPYLRDTVLSFLKKGQRVFVSGKLTYGEIKTEDGQIKHTTTIVADDIIFFNSGANNKSD